MNIRELAREKKSAQEDLPKARFKTISADAVTARAFRIDGTEIPAKSENNYPLLSGFGGLGDITYYALLAIDAFESEVHSIEVTNVGIRKFELRDYKPPEPKTASVREDVIT